MVAQPSMSLAEQVRQYVRVELFRDIKQHTYLRDDPQSAKKLYAKLHMAFDPLHIDRSNRVVFLREVFGRHDVDGFGDLTFAEAQTLIRFGIDLRLLYDQTLHG